MTLSFYIQASHSRAPLAMGVVRSEPVILKRQPLSDSRYDPRRSKAVAERPTHLHELTAQRNQKKNLMPPTSSVKPETVDWQTACSFVKRIMPVSDAAPSRMTTIARAWQRALAASNFAWSQATVGAAMSEVDQISVTAELEAAGKQLAGDLASRGVLCDHNRACVVKLESAPRTGPRLRFLLSVCLPNATLRSRLCEPFGESWQQLGARLAGKEKNWCLYFDLLALTRWWHKMRAQASPFLAPGVRGGRWQDSRLRYLQATKNQLEASKSGGRARVRRHAMHNQSMPCVASQTR